MIVSIQDPKQRMAARDSRGRCMRWLIEAARVYEREDCARTFAEDFQAHCLTGHVIETQDFFVMGRAVMRCAPVEALLNPWIRFHEPSCDAWLVWLMAGDLRKGWAHWPSFKPWLGFERENRLRWVRLHKPVASMD